VRIGPRAEVGLAVAILAAALVEQPARSDTERSPRAVAWLVAVWAPLLIRRRHPAIATWATAAAIAAAPTIGTSFPPTTIAVLLPLVLSYSCGARASTRAGPAATLALAVAIQIHVGFAEAPNGEIALTTLTPWWARLEVRRRGSLVSELDVRTRDLEAAQEAFIELSVQRERARIARDLHDIVSHHVAVMVIQAGAGRLATPWDPDAAAARFATVRDAGVQALADTDRLVTMLHPDGGATPRLAPLLARGRQGPGSRSRRRTPCCRLELRRSPTA
jgi:signal transduction histidine kinase